MMFSDGGVFAASHKTTHGPEPQLIPQLGVSLQSTKPTCAPSASWGFIELVRTKFSFFCCLKINGNFLNTRFHSVTKETSTLRTIKGTGGIVTENFLFLPNYCFLLDNGVHVSQTMPTSVAPSKFPSILETIRLSQHRSG